MRIATLVFGLLLTGVLFAAANAASEVGVTMGEEATVSAAGVGFLIALMWLLASVLVIAFPLASTVLFGLSALLGLLTPGGIFFGVQFYGIIAFVPTLMAYIGWRRKRATGAEQAVDFQR